jgi:hypothetical protein
MASEPQYLQPSPEPAPQMPTPLSPLPAPKEAKPRRRTGTLGLVLISALIGALVASAVTVLLAPRFIKVTPAGNAVVAPLGQINNTLTEESAVINVAAQAGSAVVEIKTTVVSPDQFVQDEQHGIGSGFIV